MDEDPSGNKLTRLSDEYIPIRCADPLCFGEIFRIFIDPGTKRIAYVCTQCHRGSYDDTLKEVGRTIESGDQDRPWLN